MTAPVPSAPSEIRVSIRIEERVAGSRDAASTTRLHREGPGDFLTLVQRLMAATSVLIEPFEVVPDPCPFPRLRLWGRHQ